MLKPAAHHFLEERLAAAFTTEFSSLEISGRISFGKTWDQSDEIASNLLNLIEKLNLPTNDNCTYEIFVKFSIGWPSNSVEVRAPSGRKKPNG